MPTAPPSERPTNEKRSASHEVEHALRQGPHVAHVFHRRTAVSGVLDAARRRSRSSTSACASHISLVAPSDPHRTTVLTGGRTRAPGRRTRPPSRGSPPARAHPARSARPRTASRRARFARMRSDIDLEAVQRLAQRRRGAARVRERVRERLPLRVPRTGGAFVLVLEVEQHAGRGADVLGARARERGPDRVPLVRHRRGHAAFGKPHLGHLGLREQRKVERDLRAEARRDGERRAELRDRQASRVPRQHRLRQIELLRVRVQHGEPVVAERGERPGRAAELRGQAHVGEAVARVDDPDEPARRLQPERRRHGLLQQRAAGHDGCAMLVGELRAGGRHAVELAARRSPSRRARRARPRCRGCPGSWRRDARRSDRSRNLRTSGSTGLPARRPSRTSSFDVQPVYGEDVVAEVERLRAGKRTLGGEHRPQPRVVVERLTQLGGDEQRVKGQRTPSAARPAGGCRSLHVVADRPRSRVGRGRSRVSWCFSSPRAKT